MHGEKGQALPMAILALTIGALVVTPFLGHAGSSLIGSRVYGETISQQSACDAGVEHAIWNLTRGGLDEEFTGPGDEITYQLDETINGLTASVTVTANATGGGSFAGDITDTIIDTLEYDTSNGYDPCIFHVSGSIYAVAFRGSGGDGFLKTISIDTSGEIGNSVIDSLEYDNSNGREPSVVHVSGDVFAIAYRGPGSDGFLKTVSIAANGAIGNWPIDTLEFDNRNGYEPCIIHISGNTYAIAYRGSRSDGFLKTVSIADNGNINNWTIDSLEFAPTDGYEPRIIYVSGDVYAIAYRGASADGFIKTVSIAANGAIGNWAIDTLEFDTANCYNPKIINVSDGIFAIAYRGSSNDGFIKTVAIAANGDIGNSVIDTREFADNDCYELRIIHVAENIYAIAYRGLSNDGYLKTIAIAADGNIGSDLIDALEYDNRNGYEPDIVDISSSIFAIAYRGSGSDGFVKTVEIASAGATAAYTIVASAGDRSIRAFLNIDDETVTIVSWQIE